MAHDDRRGGPGYGGVILASVLTSVVASAVTVYALSRWGQDLLAGGEPETVEVPRVVGMTPEAADEILTGRGLRLFVREEEPSTEVPEGEIAEQNPLPSSRVSHGDEIQVVVSSGMPLVDIPPVVGMEVEEARRLITQAGLQLGQVSETGEGPPGTVTATNPPQGTKTTPDTPIALTAVPAGIVVPDLVGESSREAREMIEEAGLEVGRIRRRYDDRRGPWAVLEQDPEAGTRAEPGSEVDLIINDGY